MNLKDAIEIIQKCFDNLESAGLITSKIIVNEKTIIIGEGSILDSIGFVTLVTELEEKISEQLNKDVFFVIDEIQEFDLNNPFLSAEQFAKYMIRFSGSN
jgi:hypothetical protein